MAFPVVDLREVVIDRKGTAALWNQPRVVAGGAKGAPENVFLCVVNEYVRVVPKNYQSHIQWRRTVFLFWFRHVLSIQHLGCLGPSEKTSQIVFFWAPF